MNTARTHREGALVAGRIERMSDHRAEEVRAAYTKAVLKPIRELVDAAEPTGNDRDDAQRLLDATEGLLDRIDNEGLAEDMAAHLMQSTSIGAASASAASEG